MKAPPPALRHMAIALAAACWLVACAPAIPGLEDAAARYRQDREYGGLKFVSRYLPIGTASSEVERLLGEPDYCPQSGLCYYSSNRKARSADGGRDIAVGLVVDYRDGDAVTSTLKKSWLGPIEG